MNVYDKLRRLKVPNAKLKTIEIEVIVVHALTRNSLE